jgi:hypothetical protein
MTEPFASVPGRYDDIARRAAIDEAVGRRRRSTRSANLGVFTGYRIGFDIGNGNIGWCILFERGAIPHFLTAEAIAAHNARLGPGEPKTQLPNLDLFVPLGTHKFTARDNDGKSLSKVRAEARARRRTLDARQARRWHLRDLLVKEDLLPADERDMQGLKDVKADVLRVRLLEPGTATHRHDLGRALYSALKRRGWMKPVGRAGVLEDSSFGSSATATYRNALATFNCRTVGEFLDRCQKDAKALEDRLVRKRHKPLTWQKLHNKERPKEGSDPKSYEVFPFLSPTFELMWDEAKTLREAQKDKFPIADDLWEKIKERAEFRRLLKPTKPGRCEFIPSEWRCIRALPSFQEFRILQQVDNLRRPGGLPLTDKQFARAADILRGEEKISVRELGKRMDELRLGLAEKDASRTLAGAKTDVGLAAILGDIWLAEDIKKRDRWVMRFLSRHSMAAGDTEPKEWTSADDAKLEADCVTVFGISALEKVRANIGKVLEDKFANLSAKAANILAKGYRCRLDHDARLDLLASEGGAPVVAIKLFERLPYYGQVMPDLTVEAARFAPAARTAKEELDHGRAPNPDVHIVLNRLRKVTNAIIDMMGGILPTICTVEVAREALSEEAAEKRNIQMRARERLRESIVNDIERALGDRPLPVGPRLDKLVDRWLAAIRQGWRDYDGSEIQKSLLCEGSTYQLDHVVPAAFGQFQQDNLFVSRFNHQKGKQLPWKAFRDFRSALLAFTQFGLESQREGLKAALNRRKGSRDAERLRRRVEEIDAKIAECESTSPYPRPDLLQRLRRTQTGEIERLLNPAAGDGEFKRGKITAFRPGEQAALFKKLGPDATVPESDFAARDVANIGWSSKLALRYLAHLGANVVSVKPWAVHTLRCLFDINKSGNRHDLRNHAVDAFLIAHFEARVMCPAFLKFRGQHYEDLYDSRFLEYALNEVSGSEGVFAALRGNLRSLDSMLQYVSTAHRPDNKWNPGDTLGGSFGALGGENIYSFRPDGAERERLSSIVWKMRKSKGEILSKSQLLELMERDLSKLNDPEEVKITMILRDKAKIRYRSRTEDNGRATLASRNISEAVKGRSNTFVNVEAKFAIAAPNPNLDRQIVEVEEFSRGAVANRNSLFEATRAVYRPGDTVAYSNNAWIVTALRGDGRLSLFPIDSALRNEPERPTVPSRRGQQSLIQKVVSDVLGQRLHRRRKGAGDIEPVPYQLFGK